MIWQWNFSISLKNFEKFFFAGNVLKHKVKPKNSRNSTFFQKLKFPPYFWKTLVKISSPKCSPWYTVIFLSPREGKFKKNNNQLFIALTENRLFSRQLSDGFLSAFSHQPKKSWFPWKKVKAPSLGLRKITAYQSEHFGLENFTSVFQK